MVAECGENRGGLLTDADLALALQWQKRKRSEEWAKRYGGDFAGTVAFVERSRQAQEEQLEREEKQRRNELRRARQMQMTFGGVACIFLLLLFVAFLFYRQAEKAKREAMTQTNRAQYERDEAEKARQDADKANGRLQAALDTVKEKQRDAERATQEANNSAYTAQLNAHESKARELAAFANESLGEDPERSILLGIEAMNATLRFGQPPVPAAEDALHEAILSSQVRLTFRGHSGAVNGVDFSPDGRRLATAGNDGIVQVYALNARELLHLARSRVTRKFTSEECMRYFQAKCPPLP